MLNGNQLKNASKNYRIVIMTTEDNSGGSPLRSATEQGTPKEISSTSGQMKVSQTNIPRSGTRKKVYLLECEENVTTGETNYCRRIPIFDEPFTGPETDSSGNVAEVSPNASRQATVNDGCSQTVCDVPQRLQKRLRQSTSQNAVGREISKKD